MKGPTYTKVRGIQVGLMILCITFALIADNWLAAFAWLVALAHMVIGFMWEDVVIRYRVICSMAHNTIQILNSALEAKK